MSKDERNAEYKVGYGRPPKETQFQPGKSGNPRGRPKGTRPLGSVLQRILEQKVVVKENGKAKRLQVQEVILLRLANEAMKSDKTAIKVFFALVERYGTSPEVVANMSELLNEDQQVLAEYLKGYLEEARDQSVKKDGSK